MPHEKSHQLAGKTLRVDLVGLGNTIPVTVLDWWDRITGYDFKDAHGKLDTRIQAYLLRANFSNKELPIDNEMIVVRDKEGKSHILHDSEFEKRAELNSGRASSSRRIASPDSDRRDSTSDVQ